MYVLGLDPDNRTIEYRLEIVLVLKTNHTSIGLPFHSSFGKFVPVALTYQQSSNGKHYFTNRSKVIEDKIAGTPEFFPYDTYWITLSYNLPPEILADLVSKSKPYVNIQMEYPLGVNWRRSSLFEYVDNNRYDLTVSINRASDSSMTTLLPIWAANAVLASALFLSYVSFADSHSNDNMFNNRLMVCISLFVFLPSLIFSVSSPNSTKILYLCRGGLNDLSSN